MTLIQDISAFPVSARSQKAVATGRASAAQQVMNMRTLLKRFPLALFEASGMELADEFDRLVLEILRSALSCAA